MPPKRTSRRSVQPLQAPDDEFTAGEKFNFEMPIEEEEESSPKVRVTRARRSSVCLNPVLPTRRRRQSLAPVAEDDLADRVKKRRTTPITVLAKKSPIKKTKVPPTKKQVKKSKAVSKTEEEEPFLVLQESPVKGILSDSFYASPAKKVKETVDIKAKNESSPTKLFTAIISPTKKVAKNKTLTEEDILLSLDAEFDNTPTDTKNQPKTEIPAEKAKPKRKTMQIKSPVIVAKSKLKSRIPIKSPPMKSTPELKKLAISKKIEVRVKKPVKAMKQTTPKVQAKKEEVQKTVSQESEDILSNDMNDNVESKKKTSKRNNKKVESAPDSSKDITEVEETLKSASDAQTQVIDTTTDNEKENETPKSRTSKRAAPEKVSKKNTKKPKEEKAVAKINRSSTRSKKNTSVKEVLSDSATVDSVDAGSSKSIEEAGTTINEVIETPITESIEKSETPKVATNKKESKSKVETMKKEVKAPKVETKTPKVETKTPMVETKTPKVETKTPKVETKTPKVETKTPKVIETKTPKVIETKTPKVDTKTPKVDTKTPKVDTKTPKVDTKTPKADTKTPKVDTKTPKVETIKKVTKTPKIETSKKETKTPKVDTSKKVTKTPKTVVSIKETMTPHIASNPDKENVTPKETLQVKGRKRGLEVIDTPATNKRIKLDKETLENITPKVDAIKKKVSTPLTNKRIKLDKKTPKTVTPKVDSAKKTPKSITKYKQKTPSVESSVSLIKSVKKMTNKTKTPKVSSPAVELSGSLKKPLKRLMGKISTPAQVKPSELLRKNLKKKVETKITKKIATIPKSSPYALEDEDESPVFTKVEEEHVVVKTHITGTPVRNVIRNRRFGTVIQPSPLKALQAKASRQSVSSSTPLKAGSEEPHPLEAVDSTPILPPGTVTPPSPAPQMVTGGLAKMCSIM